MLHWYGRVALFFVFIVLIVSTHGGVSSGSGRKVTAAAAVSKLDGEHIGSQSSLAESTRNLTVGILTWNLAEKILRADDCKFLKDFKDCDIVALGIY